MKRGYVRIIYNRVSDEEKKVWARKANYASYQGLYRYLREKPENQCYTAVVQALVQTIGQARIEEFIGELRKEELNRLNIEDYKHLLIKEIFAVNDKEILEKTRNVILEAYGSQLDKLKILSNLKQGKL